MRSEKHDFPSLFSPQVAGFFTNLNQTLVQAHTPQRVMGRVMSIYMLAMMGGQPLGALIAGVAADITGAKAWFTICGAMLLAIGILAFLTQPALRNMRSMPDPGELDEEPQPAAGPLRPGAAAP